jgi:NAD(P)-dependent dehydrogenase (short-subunit alcohol dehydrogenase family)
MKTIMITGSSSGFGLETARYFISKDWNVIATMRTPFEDILPRSPLTMLRMRHRRTKTYSENGCRSITVCALVPRPSS